MADPSVPLEISCRAVNERLAADDRLVLVDCRESDEHELVSIAGAVLLPMSQLPARVSELEEYRGREMVVFCHFGGRSLRVATWLRKQGFPAVQSMSGGIDQWAVEIDPRLTRY